MFLVAAIAASLAASFSFAVSAILEQRSAKQVPDRGVFAPRLLVDLAARPLWLASIGAVPAYRVAARIERSSRAALTPGQTRGVQRGRQHLPDTTRLRRSM